MRSFLHIRIYSQPLKVPITKNFLFSYLKLHLSKIASAKTFCDLNKDDFF